MKSKLGKIFDMNGSATTKQIKDIQVLLKLYKKVLHTVNNRLVYLDDYTYTTSRKHLTDLVDSLIDCDTQIDKQTFDDSVSECHISLYLLSIMDKTLLLVRDYPENGKIYYEILERYYYDNFRYTHSEIIEVLDLSESTYYRHYKSAVRCFLFHFKQVIQMDDTGTEVRQEIFC